MLSNIRLPSHENRFPLIIFEGPLKQLECPDKNYTYAIQSTEKSFDIKLPYSVGFNSASRLLAFVQSQNVQFFITGA